MLCVFYQTYLRVAVKSQILLMELMSKPFKEVRQDIVLLFVESGSNKILRKSSKVHTYHTLL